MCIHGEYKGVKYRINADKEITPEAIGALKKIMDLVANPKSKHLWNQTSKDNSGS